MGQFLAGSFGVHPVGRSLFITIKRLSEHRAQFPVQQRLPCPFLLLLTLSYWDHDIHFLMLGGLTLPPPEVLLGVVHDAGVFNADLQVSVPTAGWGNCKKRNRISKITIFFVWSHLTLLYFKKADVSQSCPLETSVLNLSGNLNYQGRGTGPSYTALSIHSAGLLYVNSYLYRLSRPWLPLWDIDSTR